MDETKIGVGRSILMIQILGVFLGLGSAIFNALDNVLINQSGKKMSAVSFAFLKAVASFVLYLPLLTYNGFNVIDNRFWMILFVTTFVSGIAGLLYVKAIHVSGIGLTVPFQSLTPLFVIFVAFFMVGDVPNIWSLSGVMFIVIGAYILNISQFKKGFFEPFVAIFKERGSFLMLLSAAIFGLNAVLFRLGFQYSDQMTFLASVTFTNILFFLILSVMQKKKFRKIKNHAEKNMWLLFGSGVLLVSGDLCTAHAITLMQVSYAIALKRTTVFFSVIFGALVFKEKGLSEKALGSMIMLVGLVLITLFG